MAKAYFISFYRKISDPDKLAAYAKLAGPAVEAAGGRFLARGAPAQVYEAGQARAHGNHRIRLGCRRRQDA